MNVTQDRANYYVRAELPGVRAEDLDIQVERRTLTVSGRRDPVREENVSYHRKERADGEFSRSLTLAAAFDPDRIEARYTAGLLTIMLPKPETQRARQVTVQTA